MYRFQCEVMALVVLGMNDNESLISFQWYMLVNCISISAIMDISAVLNIKKKDFVDDIMSRYNYST
jgi:hypothetical protein